MPKKISDFLIGLAKKSGLDLSPEQQEYINKIDVELDDAIVTPIDNSLISLKDAKNNHSEIRNFYHKQVYDGFDASLGTLMDEMELDDNTRNEILVERNVSKRLPLLVKKVRDLEQRKANADKPDKAAINKQIEDLNAEIRSSKAQVEAAKQEFEKQIKQFRIDSKKDTLVSNYKTIYDDLDPEVKAMTIRNLIDKNLQDNNAQFSFDDNGNFVLTKKDGTNYYGEGNQQEFPASFVEKILSRSKILKTTSTAAQQPAGDANQNGQNPAGGSANGNGKPQNHLLKSLNQKAISDINQNAANPVFGVGAMGA